MAYRTASDASGYLKMGWSMRPDTRLATAPAAPSRSAGRIVALVLPPRREMTTGWTQIGGSWFYMSSSGAMYRLGEGRRHLVLPVALRLDHRLTQIGGSCATSAPAVR